MKLVNVFNDLEKKFGPRVAIRSEDKDYTYTDLKNLISIFCEQLNCYGISSKHTIGILMPHGINLSLTLLGTLSYAITCPLNPDLKVGDYNKIFLRNHIDALLCLNDSNHPAITVAKSINLPILTVINKNHSIEIKSISTNIAPPKQDFHKKNLLIETSGTTSQPKLVGLTHTNLFISAQNVVDSLKLNEKDICLHFLPSYHIGGIVDVLLAPLISGGSVICMPTFSYDIFYKELLHKNPTWTQAPPVMLEQIINKHQDHQHEISRHTLRLIRSVSAPLTPERMQQLEKIFSIPVIEIYGMSEAAGVITSNPLPPAIRKPGSVGITTNCKLLIKNSASLKCKPNEIGEIYIHGENVIDQYLNTDTQEYFKDPGWFKTGDLGYFDEEGYLFLTGRSKDIINRGGEKISPAEIDQLVIELNDVTDAASFPIFHKTLGEDIALAVVLNNEKSKSIKVDEIKNYLKSKVAFFKVPQKIIFVDHIPRNQNGKLQRKLLENHFSDLLTNISENTLEVDSRPLDSIEEYLSKIWVKVLGKESIGPDDDFFECGGDSLLAASFINQIQEKWGTTIYVSALFDAPTLSKFSEYLKQFYPDVINKILGQEVLNIDTEHPPLDELSIQKLKSLLVKTISNPYISAVKNKSAVFILSPPRSGSTLLRAVLAGNSNLFAPPELYLLGHDSLMARDKYYSGSHRSQLEGNIRALMALKDCKLDVAENYFFELLSKDLSTQEYYKIIQDLAHEKILVDKTPAYAVDLDILNLAEKYFENPKFIFLQRHPYGMIRSFEEARLEQLWFPRLIGKDYGAINSFPFNRRELAELIWIILNQNIITFLSSIPNDRQISIKYESLVKEPELTTTNLCNWLGVPFEESMLQPQQKTPNRMVDGIHDISRMIGDPKFHNHVGITASAADQWKSFYTHDFLSTTAQSLAQQLGYNETISNSSKRETFEF